MATFDGCINRDWALERRARLTPPEDLKSLPLEFCRFYIRDIERRADVAACDAPIEILLEIALGVPAEGQFSSKRRRCHFELLTKRNLLANPNVPPIMKLWFQSDYNKTMSLIDFLKASLTGE